MPEVLKKLNLKGYHYDPETEDKLGSIFYISDECEDDWIRISKISGAAYETYVITFVVGCEDTKIKISACDEGQAGNFEIWLNEEIASL